MSDKNTARSRKGSKKNADGKAFAAPVSDPRFARLHTDPRFLRPNREEGKVVLDDRFKDLLKGDAPSKKGPKTDKFGRPIKQDYKGQEELQSLYRTVEDKEQSDGSSSDSEDDVSDEDVDEATTRKIDYARGGGDLESSGDESSSSQDEDSEDEDEDDDDESEAEDESVLIGSALARRREANRAKSDDDDDDDDDDLQVDPSELAELDAQAERSVKREAKVSRKAAKTVVFAGDTNRLAAVNMDWDHIRAMDLFKVFSSVASPAGRSRPASTVHAERRRQQEGGVLADRPILPVQGRCMSVRIYPSEFGRKRMAKEMVEGPPKEIFKSEEDAAMAVASSSKSDKRRRRKKDAESDSEDEDEELFQIDEGGDFDEEALRQYQLDRLRYYYAIATFDSPQTARYIIDQIDGSEMEHSANMFDLSFVPAEMSFPDWQAPSDDAANEGWRDEATESTQGEATYKGVDFMTDALRHSKVKLTWDADDPQRAKVTRNAAQTALSADQLRDDDFKAYLASSASEESESDEEGDEAAKERDRVRALLGLGDINDDAGKSNGFGKARSAAFADARKAAKGQGVGQGDMQITFLPGLSEAAERKKKGVRATQDDDNETTLEKYKRKQKEKRERRKEQSSAPSDDGPVEETETKSFDFDDPFFADDGGEVDFDAALAAEKKGKKAPGTQKQKGMRGAIDKESDDERDTEAERRALELMLDNSDEERGAGHFSLKDIVKAEQAADGSKKKGRWQKKKEKKLAAQGGVDKKGNNEIQPGFEIDVNDARFAGLYGDHQFAVDPNHPSFVKTKNMQRLVDERRKQGKSQRKNAAAEDAEKHNTGHAGKDARTMSGASADDSLSNLVQSVKKRSANGVPLRPPSHKKSRQDTP